MLLRILQFSVVGALEAAAPACVKTGMRCGQQERQPTVASTTMAMWSVRDVVAAAVLERMIVEREGSKRGESELRSAALVVVQLEAHSVVDLVVGEGDVILVDCVPLLDANLLGACARLCSDELL